MASRVVTSTQREAPPSAQRVVARAVLAHPSASVGRARRSVIDTRTGRQEPSVLVVITILSALGAVAAGGAATAVPDLDVVLRAALATAVTVMAWRARPWSLLAAASLALVASGPDPMLFSCAFA